MSSRSLSLIAVLLIVPGPRAHAADDPLLVVPTGLGDGLALTADIARHVAFELRSTRSAPVKLAYPFERRTYAPSRAARVAKQLLRNAKRSYKVLELESVRKSAFKALKLFKKEIKRGAKPDGYVEALHYLGAAETVDGNASGGFKWLNDAYLFNKRAPNSSIFNPQVQAIHAKVANSDDHVGTLELEVEPGALLWLNGTLYGAARGKVELRAGLYLVRIGRPGFLTFEKWMRVKRSKTRKLSIRLQKGPTTEPPTVTRLRKEMDKLPAASTLLLATDYGSAEVIAIGASANCTKKECVARLRWARGGKWIRSESVDEGTDPESVAKQLLGIVDAPEPKGPQSNPALSFDQPQCRDDAQCLSDQRCVDGRCEAVVPVTRKWWFWTIIGVVAVGAGTTAVVLLTRPENPVLEVR